MAILFDGVNQWIDLGLSIASLKNVTGATISAWIKLTTAANTCVIGNLSIGPPPGVSSTSRISLQINASAQLRTSGRADDGETTESLTGVATLSDGVWYHVAAICDYAGDMLYLYLDGALDASSAVTFAAVTSNTNSKCAGLGAEDDGSGSAFIDGAIDDLRIYNRALSAAEVLTIKSCRGVDGITSGLVDRWCLDEGAIGATAAGAGTVKDIAAGLVNGTPTSAPLYAGSVIRCRRKAA